MIKNWSRAILALIVLPIVVAVAAVLSTTPYLVIAIIFPLLVKVLLLNFNKKSTVKFFFHQEPNVVYAGDEVVIRARMTIEQGLGLYFIRLPVMDSFKLLDEDTNDHIIFKGLSKVEHLEYVYKMRALRRGIFKFPDISFSFHPPLSLARGEQGSVPSNIEIKVLPRVNLLKRSQVSLRSLHE